jgi:hypothetical protein
MDECRLGLSFYFIFGFIFFLLYLPEWMAITELLGSHFVFVVVVVVALFFSSFAPGLGGCLAFPGLPYWIEREREWRL